MPRSGADRSARLAENDLTPYFATTGTVLRQTGTNPNIDNDGDASFRLSMNFHPLPTFRSGPWRAGLGRRGRRARTQNPVSPRSRLCPDSLNQGAARMRALATRRPVDSWVLDVTSAVGTANRGLLSCSRHPIATRRWWLGELVPFPSTVLHETCALGSVSRPPRLITTATADVESRHRHVVPSRGLFCSCLPDVVSLPLTKRLDSLLLAMVQKVVESVAGCWVPDSGLSCRFQASGNCLTAMLGSVQGVVKPAMAVDRDPMRAFYPVLGLFRDVLMQCREQDGIERDGVWWLLPTSGRVPYAEPCGGSFLGPGRPRTQSPTSTQLPAPTARSRPHNSAVAPEIWTDQIPKPSTN